MTTDFAGARTGEPLEERIARLEDIEAIHRLKGRYASYCDNGYDPEALIGLFAEGANWESNAFGSYHGRDEIHRFFSTISDEIRWATHFMICPSIDIAADRLSATGSWYLLELGTLTGTDEPDALDAVIMTANYTDTFVKRDGRWWIKDLSVRFHQVSNLDAGWVRQPFRGST